ncbi:MAG: manganese transporter, partial [Anaerolineales bacterium]
FYSGLNLEARMTDIFEQIGETRPAVAVTESIPAAQVLQEVQFHQPDPHIWMDVGRWSLVSDAVLKTLSELDPEGQATYTKNALAYRAQLKELDDYVRQQIARIPEEQRLLVTAHDAFQYYADAYAIEVFAPQGITTQSEASVEDIRRVIALMVDRHIPAIFVESSVPPDIVEAIVEGAAAVGHKIVIGGQLFSDAMGELGTPEGTYVGMLRHNTDTIVKALLGGS